MTWTKLGDDFGDQCARAELSDAAFRTHVEGLGWTMRRETGGLIRRGEIRRFAETADPQAAIRELIAAGWWENVDADRLRILKNMDDQPEPDVIEARRKLAAERQRRKRRKDARLDLDVDVSRRDNPRDDPRDPGRVGTGRGKTPTSSNSDSRSKTSIDVGKKDSQHKDVEEAWPTTAVFGEGSALSQTEAKPPEFAIFNRGNAGNLAAQTDQAALERV